MARMDLELLARVADAFIDRRDAHLSPGERRELFAIAQALSCKESANALGVCYETVRARRKRVYRKLGLAGAGEVTSWLLRVTLEILENAPDRPGLAAGALAMGPTGQREGLPAGSPLGAGTMSDARS